MAIGLCKALEERGFKIPEDIIVVGSDSTEEGQTSPKILTSYISPGEEMGEYAVGALQDIRVGKKPGRFEGRAELLLGETCGCMKDSKFGISTRRDGWETEIYENGFYSINNSMRDNVLIQTDVLGYVSTIYSYAYQIKGVESFDLCLVDSIGSMGQTELPGNEGYPKKMIHAIRYNRSNKDCMVGIEETFDTSDMLPGLTDYTDDPKAYFFNPVFFENSCFGYAVLRDWRVSEEI